MGILHAVIADDDRVMRLVLTQHAKQAGFAVLQASSKQQAMEHCAASGDKISTILTDNDMEYQNAGLELLSEIRSLQKHVPVTMVSDREVVETMQDFKSISGDKLFIPKSEPDFHLILGKRLREIYAAGVKHSDYEAGYYLRPNLPLHHTPYVSLTC